MSTCDTGAICIPFFFPLNFPVRVASDVTVKKGPTVQQPKQSNQISQGRTQERKGSNRKSFPEQTNMNLAKPLLRSISNLHPPANIS